MPIENLTARYRELGRLKFGEDRGDRPAQLHTWRITSPDPSLIAMAADVYGGTPTDDGLEVITTATELEVWLPPQNVAAGQWYELWGAGGIKRRCNGIATVEPGQNGEWVETGPCECDPAHRQCKIRTVLRVLLPDIHDIGIWRLSTGSINAAYELPAAAEVIQRLNPNTMAPAILALEERSTKKPGEPLHEYVVPVLRTTVTLRELLAGAERPPSLGTGDAGTPPPAPLEAGRSEKVPRPDLPAAQEGPQPGPEDDSPDAARHRAKLDDIARFLDDVDGSFPGAHLADIVAVLEMLEELMIAARLWPEDALTSAARGNGLPETWRQSAITADVKTFATRALLAATRDLDRAQTTNERTTP